ncbi:thiosulfate/3-mercaptopyruvate sulfurtransferase [Thermosporothrix hazakensis]|jgi:thiosulfate/3-mercaptopyruvate sulfurtransferase|uniref:Sulfurtransferase n=2 Tax=Thermosporothrix TaxID=768650 RepID=A0A326U743_THEHA|nr:sulfurtransferase [Thermosporothrix hazakensis]PZW30547.1 thiosulfate/3-mercaptopyruvate sulfurtransferase [Thermosporothrix hazakensis]BBH91262.1 sulfurtransferase [Thermosporothrix sp. COM3]GCE49408.1 sulfurtransferase [Thermosporothrix hazakensis]
MAGSETSTGYAHPEVLVETDWVADHLHDADIRLIEADEDVLLYELGHIPGAVKLDWHVDVQDKYSRDFIDQQGFEQLMSRWGITNDTTIVLYGDKNNWYACYAFWLFSMYGHARMKIMNGGRAKWEAEHRPMTREVPHYEPTRYKAQPMDESARAFRDEVLLGLKNPGRRLIDVRSPQEYSGELIHMVNYPQEGAQRGGHIPGAKNIPWATAANPDGTFKSAEELRQIYGSNDVTPDKEVVTYCRIGERSAHTWFVLTKLLGYPRVRNYDGSWTEWGNLVRSPIEK